MATRHSIDMCLFNCEDALQYADEQYMEGARQEHGNDLEYTQAQNMLEQAIHEIDVLWNSADNQQRERLYRMRLLVDQMQNQMILRSNTRTM
ncbi:YtzC family protein [Peribacillus sp. SCS-155]|uniref:YtzC family protein n=1 Tax=Peribacillus sedimenti TaxID=3115297 RepID=UPI00390612FE